MSLKCGLYEIFQNVECAVGWVWDNRIASASEPLLSIVRSIRSNDLIFVVIMHISDKINNN